MSRSTRKASDTATPPPAPTVGVPDFLDVDGLIADQRIRIVVVCGAGGVGKTTSAAALALRAAEAGRKVVVLTIDPARRLAQSLGVAELDNTPRPVRGLDTGNGGSLDAMMLDMKRTFDEVVLAHSTPETAGSILENPFYVALSSSVRRDAGVHGDGEARSAARGGGGDRLLGPDRGRHPAGPLGAGLPGRARAPQLAAGRTLPAACCWPVPEVRSDWSAWGSTWSRAR